MEPNDVKHVVVVGAGTMGHSIAQVFAQAGIEVALVDMKEELFKRAFRLIRSNLETLADYGRVNRADIGAIIDRIKPMTDIEGACRSADFAVEAVTEVPAIKKEVFSRLDAALPPHAVITSNTSTLNIFEIAQIKRNDKLVGAHWFMPPHIIPLVEVAPGPETSAESVALTAALLKKIGKQPVVMKKFVPGFIVNRLQNAVFITALSMLQTDCATVEDIDLAIKSSLGIRLPITATFQNVDFNGLKLVGDIMKSAGLTPPPIIADNLSKGFFGVETSKGIYDYGGRSEEELLRTRDNLFLKMLDHLEKIGAFKPI